jgi:hypothetical protein
MRHAPDAPCPPPEPRLPPGGGNLHHRQGLRHHGDPQPAVGGGLHEGEPGRRGPGDGGRLRHWDLGPHLRLHRHLRGLPPHERGGGGGPAGEGRGDARGDGRRQRRRGGLPEPVEPRRRPHHGAVAELLHRPRVPLVVRGGPGPARHPVFPREQLRHLRLLQGTCAQERRLLGLRPDLARHGRGGERHLPGPPGRGLRRLLQQDPGLSPVSRDLFYYTRSGAPEPVRKFIAWILGPEGQAVVRAAGYFPVKKRAAS